VLARLEIILHVLQEFGYDPNEWNWEPVFRHLISPSLFHSNVDVRLIAVELCVTFYQLLGQEIRIAVNNIENLKPNLLAQINQRMDEVEEIATKNQEDNANKLQNGLSQVLEANDEEGDQSPMLAKNKMLRKQTSVMLTGKTPQPYQADDIKNNINAVMNDKDAKSKTSTVPLKTNGPSGNLGANKTNNTKSTTNLPASNTKSTTNLPASNTNSNSKMPANNSNQPVQNNVQQQQPQSQASEQPQTQISPQNQLNTPQNNTQNSVSNSQTLPANNTQSNTQNNVPANTIQSNAAQKDAAPKPTQPKKKGWFGL